MVQELRPLQRAIRYIRENFFAARQWKDLNDLNCQALAWCDGYAADRPCPEQLSHSVRTIFVEEQPSLLKLPDNPYPTIERIEVKVGKTPYVRFDLNDYSVPYKYVKTTLTVAATVEQVTILSGAETIATHLRSYDKGAQIENEAHIQELVARKHQASQHRGMGRLTHAVPIAITVLKQAAERGFHMGQTTMQLLRLLDSYGITEMNAALTEAAASNTPHPNSVRFILEKRRQAANKLPVISLSLSQDERVRNLIVIPHNLSNYANLAEGSENEK